MSVAEQAASNVLTRLRDAGHIAYFAGGCVRDRLLGLTPKDFDVATDAPPAKVRDVFARTQAVGQAFGVVLVHDFGAPIEVATFRTDGDYKDGRRPEAVTFADAEHDAQRRDFTINGLFFDPREDRVIDYVGGRRDLADRVLRAIGDPEERFDEDHLRMLRAVRFAARFGLTIEPLTAAAITRDAQKLSRISGERIADELRRMLAPPTRSAAYALLWRFGLLRGIFQTLMPEGNYSFDADQSLLLALSPGATVSPPLAILCAAIDCRWQAAHRRPDLLSNLSPNEVSKILGALRGALKLSNDETGHMADVARWTHRLLITAHPPVALMKRFLARPHAKDALALLDAMAAIGVATERIAALRRQLDGLGDGEVAPPPLLTGDMLVAAGYRPGPGFKSALDTVYDEQLEGRVRTGDEALAMGKTLLSNQSAAT
ncbi:MAG TPA: CCA tRNA nucleotidyltransferase [Tepidisphaeraceae bacterium]